MLDAPAQWGCPAPWVAAERTASSEVGFGWFPDSDESWVAHWRESRRQLEALVSATDFDWLPVPWVPVETAPARDCGLTSP